MNYYHCYIEFAPRSMNREELKAFEKKCRTDRQSARHFAGVKGRTYYFRFGSELAKQSFMLALERQLVSLGFLTERHAPDLWSEAPPRPQVVKLPNVPVRLTA